VARKIADGLTFARHTLREWSLKMERRKGQRYSSELRRQAVERMNACGNIVGLARELGVFNEGFTL